MRTSVSLCALMAAMAAFGTAHAETQKITSPDSRNSIEVTLDAQGLRYDVSRDGKAVISPSPLALTLQNRPPFGTSIGDGGFKLVGAEVSAGEDDYTLPVGKVKTVKAPYSETVLTLQADKGDVRTLQIVARAYNDGVALRYVIPKQDGVGRLSIQDEGTAFNFAGDYDCWGLNQGRFENSFEGEYDKVKASQIRNFNLFQAPLVCKTGAGETAFAIAESDMKDYPGAYYMGRGDGGNGVKVILTPRKDNDPGARFNTSAARIDASNGFSTPWRVVMLADSAGKLIESNLVNSLAPPSVVKDTSWIKPGLTAWDWWNGNQVGLPDQGINTKTYKAYIDFAASLGLGYILIDEGWSVKSSVEPVAGSDVTKPNTDMDMAEIIRYGKSKNVGVWVWVQWQQLDKQMDEALATYETWGIKGVKVDFMNRNDQDIMPFYHHLLGKAAEHHLMVDLHGAFPPAGLMRTYPNYVTQEGVLGAENNKWSHRITAKHNITIAYTRMLAGPMDYTPGGFRHVTPAEFPAKQQFINPYVMTTRGQAVAMYVVYDSPSQMVSDSPLAYKKPDGSWEDGVDFLKIVPTTWDETRFVSGDIGEDVVLARRSGDTWYIGAMTDKARSVTVNLDFLADKGYAARVWQDGDTISTLKTSDSKVAKGQTLTLTLGDNGGAVAVITPEAKPKTKKKK